MSGETKPIYEGLDDDALRLLAILRKDIADHMRTVIPFLSSVPDEQLIRIVTWLHEKGYIEISTDGEEFSYGFNQDRVAAFCESIRGTA